MSFIRPVIILKKTRSKVASRFRARTANYFPSFHSFLFLLFRFENCVDSKNSYELVRVHTFTTIPLFKTNLFI